MLSNMFFPKLKISISFLWYINYKFEWYACFFLPEHGLLICIAFVILKQVFCLSSITLFNIPTFCTNINCKTTRKNNHHKRTAISVTVNKKKQKRGVFKTPPRLRGRWSKKFQVHTSSNMLFLVLTCFDVWNLHCI